MLVHLAVCVALTFLSFCFDSAQAMVPNEEPSTSSGLSNNVPSLSGLLRNALRPKVEERYRALNGPEAGGKVVAYYTQRYGNDLSGLRNGATWMLLDKEKHLKNLMGSEASWNPRHKKFQEKQMRYLEEDEWLRQEKYQRDLCKEAERKLRQIREGYAHITSEATHWRKQKDSCEEMLRRLHEAAQKSGS